jgi:hypothetical protein
MAFHRTIVARTGFVTEMVAQLQGHSALVGADGQWLGPVADDEAGAIEAATEYFENTNFPESVVAPDSVEAWDRTDFTGEILIGWSMTADGWFAEDED